MNESKFCPDCGASLTAEDRFCGDCGFDFNKMPAKPAAYVPPVPPDRPAAPAAYQPSQPQNNQPSPAPAYQPASTQSYQPAQNPAASYSPSPPPMGRTAPGAGRSTASLGTSSGGNKNALIIMVSALLVIFLGGGGIYWWLSRDPGQGSGTNPPAVSQNNNSMPAAGAPVATNAPTANAPSANAPAEAASAAELDRAATYLCEPGLKCTFFVNYPDGMSGVVNRISGQAVPNEAVRVSDVEVGVDMGEEYGFGFHYVERADGTYYIMDTAPFEIYPVLKNNMMVGQTWSYDTEYGSIKYEVADMGVDLDLGFATFKDCLLLKEDNQAVGQQTINYYAPGRGKVYVVAPGGNFEYYKMTGMTKIDLAEAANNIIKWCPNYMDIGDDRSQSY